MRRSASFYQSLRTKRGYLPFIFSNRVLFFFPSLRLLAYVVSKCGNLLVSVTNTHPLNPPPLAPKEGLEGVESAKVCSFLSVIANEVWQSAFICDKLPPPQSPASGTQAVPSPKAGLEAVESARVCFFLSVIANAVWQSAFNLFESGLVFYQSLRTTRPSELNSHRSVWITLVILSWQSAFIFDNTHPLNPPPCAQKRGWRGCEVR